MFNRSTMKYCSLLLTFTLVMSSHLILAQGQKNKGKGNSTTQKNAVKKLTGEQMVAHLLDRITFGARPSDSDRVMKMGWQKYLDEQLHPERIADAVVEQKLKNLKSINLNTSELAKYYLTPQKVQEALKAKGLELPEVNSNQNNPIDNPPNEVQLNAEVLKKRREAIRTLNEMGLKPQQQIVQELQQAKLLRAIYSEKQLQEVMVDVWFNHFNVFIQKGADRVLTTSYERDVIRPRVFGKFEDLLLATAESPAMLFYLDNWMSASPEASMAQRKFNNGLRIFNQNGNIPNRRARGLNENYAREIMELHTLGVDGGYTQKDVQEVARCLTGWTIHNPRAGGDFVFNPNMHDDGEKVVLGHKIPSGGGKKDGETVIKILAHHPSTARFISTKLARKFVSDNPPQSLIDRMTQTFLKSDGDIREVLRAMFNAPEFWETESYRAKIKTPFEMTVSAVRAIGAETNAGPALHRRIAQMGEGLFLAQPPTGYPDTAEHWVNSGALLERMNFALALSSNQIPGTRVNLDSFLSGTNGLQPSQIIDRFAKLLLHGELSPQSRATIDKALNGQPSIADNSGTGIDAPKIVGLILGSPEFQRQ